MGAEDPVNAKLALPRRTQAWRQCFKGLRLPITAALLAFLLWSIDIGRSLTIMREANLALLVAALAIMVAERYVSAYRWYLLLHGKYPEVRLRHISRLVLTSTFLGYFLPGMGVEALRVYGLSLATANPAHAFASVLVERVLGLLVLIGFVFVGLLFTPLQLPPIVGEFAVAALAVLLLGIATVMHPRGRRTTDAVLGAVRLQAVRTRVRKVYDCLDVYRDLPGLLVWTTVVACVFQFLKIVSLPVAGLALGITGVPLADFLVVVPTVMLLGMLPISIGGLGVREASYVYLLEFAGVSAEAAFSLAVVHFLLHLLSVAPGAWLYARRGMQP